jgi:sialate O-acetylesterase
MNFSLLTILLCPLFSIAQLKVAEVFSDNMLLQRNMPIKVWGKGIPGSSVNILFSKEKKVAVINKDSAWMVSFRKQKENTNPQILSVASGAEQIEFKNILIGDVWICTGQSNMEWPMIKEQHWKVEIHNANQPNIRLLNPPPAGRNVFGVSYTDSLIKRLTKEKFYEWNGWQQCDSSSVKLMSAVAYYFASNVFSETGVPIGIINLSIGGAPLETFISTEALSNHEKFSKKVNGNWLFNDALPVWVRERGRQNVGNINNVPADEQGPNHAYKPGFAFKAGIDMLRDFSVKGILIYQGESNAEEPERVDEYKELFKLLMKEYREIWSNKQLPIYWVQLSSIERKHWPLFRNNQLQLLKETDYTGMAVTSDIGLKNDVHPPDKKTVGERLARWALYNLYKKSITVSGPLALKGKYNNGKVIISFKYTAKGLMTSDGISVKGFSIDGDKEIEALITKHSITMAVKTKPEYVYYGWQPFSNGNLVNSENLPASTFKIRVQ